MGTLNIGIQTNTLIWWYDREWLIRSGGLHWGGVEEERNVHSKGNNTDQVILVISIIIINAIIIISIIIIKAIIIFIFIFIVKLSQTLLLIGSIWELFPPTGSVSQPSASRLNPKIYSITFTLTSLSFTFSFISLLLSLLFSCRLTFSHLQACSSKPGCCDQCLSVSTFIFCFHVLLLFPDNGVDNNGHWWMMWPISQSRLSISTGFIIISPASCR